MKYLIITALPFRKYGNQSLLRFVNMLLNNGNSVSLISTGFDSKGEKVINNDRLTYLKLNALRDYVYNLLSSKPAPPPIGGGVTDNFFLTIKSEDVLPPFGSHNIKTAVKKWLNFMLMILDNLYLFFFLILFKNAEIKSADCIIAYEFNNAFSARWISVFFKKKLISKYQGVLLKAANRKILDCYLYYPDNYFGLVKSDLCIMVNDGTDGEFYAAKKGNKNILFSNHGVLERSHDSSLIHDFNALYKDKFIVFNNASGSLWKRVDRAMRFLTYLSPEIRGRVIVLSTYYGPYQDHIRDYIKLLGVDDCFNLIGNIPDEHCNALLTQSDVVLMTNDMSNLGNPMLEALFYNVPAISINDGSLNGLIASGENGFLIDLDNDFDKNLAKLITKLVIDETELDKIKANLKRQSKVFSLKVQQDKEYERIVQLTQVD